MRRCVIVLCILAALTVPVLAMDVLEEERQILNVDTLTDGLPDDAQDALRAYSPAARTDPGEAILVIIKWASGLSVSTLREAVQTASLLLSAALICQLVRQSVPDDRLHIQAMTAAIAGFAAGKEHAALIDAQSSAMGYVLGMTGSAALMLLFSTCCFMKVASG